jgi:N-acetylmuramoyl-L-alanine amidase
MFKLALGSGHGFNTAGKRCLKSLDLNETREWVLNDRIADKVEVLLATYGGVAVLRLDDSDDGADDIALSSRVKQANEWDADFYLSIHHNAGIEGGKGGGIVAYCHPKAGGETVAWRDELYEALIEHTGLRGNRSDPKATADHKVTRETKMPAVLLELGFMDSATDVPVILTEEYASGCAAAIVEVIVRKAGLSRKQTDTANLPDAWAAQAWYNATAQGVLDGTRPRDPLTRQEFAVVLSKLGLLGKN